jgi:hypothetical protein
MGQYILAAQKVAAENGVTSVQDVSVASKAPADQLKLKGTISPGQPADIVVLEPDIFHIDPVAIENVKVDLTLLGGEVIYDRSAEPRK